jgi:Fe2+ transport system protein FeoA
MSETTLGQLKVGQTGTVRKITLPSDYEQRLAELGLMPGSTVEIVQIAPLGDPIAIKCDGRRMGMRLSDANGISVET